MNHDYFILVSTRGAKKDSAYPFPISFALCLGGLPHSVEEREEAERAADGRPPFPFNVRFEHADFVAHPAAAGQLGVGDAVRLFDTVMCLSTSKWVHLNGTT